MDPVTALSQLPYREVWTIDTEFIADRGAKPIPVCLVALELRSGNTIRQWASECGPRPPIPTGPDTLAVAWFATAEWSYFLAAGWPLPAETIDLFAEYRSLTNGRASNHPGLLDALVACGLQSITKAEKTTMRDLVLRGGPWSPPEQAAILAYCEGDVHATAALFLALLPAILERPYGLEHALLRGAYAAGLALVERRGVPVNLAGWERLRDRLPAIKPQLIEAVDRHYGVHEHGHFRHALFEAYLARENITGWPRTLTGRLAVDGDTLKDQARLHPQLQQLRELRYTLDELKLADLAVGQDGRNRVILGLFGSITGRNQPSASRYIFGPATWLRSLIKPDPGRALIYADWKSQEIAIAAVLSGDEALLTAVRSGDPYMNYAIAAGLAPEGATKASHPAARETAKVVALGLGYGMGEHGLARRLGRSLLDARQLLHAHQRAYARFWRWSDGVVDHVMCGGALTTLWGWSWRPKGSSIDPATGRLKETNDRSARNWLMQAHGAEMLRAAVTLAAERGLEIVATVHDALLVECDQDRLPETEALVEDVMGEASAAVLDGFRVAIDQNVITWPGHFSDERGVTTWRLVHRLLDDQAL